jgi:hypothetical protein
MQTPFLDITFVTNSAQVKQPLILNFLHDALTQRRLWNGKVLVSEKQGVASVFDLFSYSNVINLTYPEYPNTSTLNVTPLQNGNYLLSIHNYIGEYNQITGKLVNSWQESEPPSHVIEVGDKIVTLQRRSPFCAYNRHEINGTATKSSSPYTRIDKLSNNKFIATSRSAMMTLVSYLSVFDDSLTQVGTTFTIPKPMAVMGELKSKPGTIYYTSSMDRALHVLNTGNGKKTTYKLQSIQAEWIIVLTNDDVVIGEASKILIIKQHKVVQKIDGENSYGAEIAPNVLGYLDGKNRVCVYDCVNYQLRHTFCLGKRKFLGFA